MSDEPAVECGMECGGCTAECAACSVLACAKCEGCNHAREMGRRSRAAIAAVQLLQISTFGFNPHQRRGPDGRWIKMGDGELKRPRRSRGGRDGSDRGNETAERPGARANADHPHREKVAQARQLAEVIGAEEDTPGDINSSTKVKRMLEELAARLEAGLDEGNAEEIERAALQLGSRVDLYKRIYGLDEPDRGDGIQRGVRGFRALRRQQSKSVKPTREQIQDGLREYLSNPRGYKAINDVARNRSVAFKDLTKAQQERVRQLDRIVEVFEGPGTTLTEDVQVWRGVRNPADFLGDLKPGMEFVDDAPVSTSLNRDWAGNFASDWDNKKIDLETSAMFKIRLKKGQKGLLAASVSGEFGDPAGWAEEQEMLLPPGTRFRVVGRGEDTDVGGKKKVPTYEVEVVETPVLAPRAPTKKGNKRLEEVGRDIKKTADLPPFERGRMVDFLKEIVRASPYETTAAPELQDALTEALKRDFDLNTKSAKLMLKEFNKWGGIRG